MECVSKFAHRDYSFVESHFNIINGISHTFLRKRLNIDNNKIIFTFCWGKNRNIDSRINEMDTPDAPVVKWIDL